MVLSSRAESRKALEGIQFEVSDGKITQTHESHETIEIPFAQIESLREFPGWLVIGGGEPVKQIAIPAAVVGFEELKRELRAYRPVASTKAMFRLFQVLPLALFVGACFYLFTSRDRVVVLVTGGVVLLLEGLGFYSIWRLRKVVLRPKLLLFIEIFSWLVTAWIVYERAKGAR